VITFSERGNHTEKCHWGQFELLVLTGVKYYVLSCVIDVIIKNN
jgi:hypothetical protein